MKLLKEIICKNDLNLDGKTFFREAVRGIIYQNGQLLMIYSTRNGDYKFPGGGREANEPLQATLAREIREECGANLLEITGEFGRVIEYDTPMEKDFDLFKMTSYYFFCRIDTKTGLKDQKLDDYERDLGFTPVWIMTDQALQNNLKLLETPEKSNPRWTKREAFVLGLLKEQIKNGVYPFLT
jgi:8-oxo-dGTP pyrophosphatase MutT (NUDIX family)